MTELTNQLELFTELNDEEMGRVREISETREVQPGAVILVQGQPVEFLYVILDGMVRVSAVFGDEDDVVAQDEEVVVRLATGECFGELSFVTGETPTLSVFAEETTRVAAISQPRLRELIAADAEICRKLLFAITRTLVHRLRNTGKDLVLTRYFMHGK